MSLFADLHRHLGGSVVPRVLWKFLEKREDPVVSGYLSFYEFEKHYTSKKSSLEEFLEAHKLVERVQTAEFLPYFIKRLVRGAYTFENLAYLELRYTPYLRTNRSLSEYQRIESMEGIVDVIKGSSNLPEYPLVMPQIFCLHSSLPYEINLEILKLAIRRKDAVCAIDVAGSDKAYLEKVDEFLSLFEMAKENGLKTTGHLFETKNGMDESLLPYLDRIGHGIQIPIERPDLLKTVRERGQCLEVCPTSYLMTGTLQKIEDVKTVFNKCFDEGVDISICTDNAGLHNVRLLSEYEQLISKDIIGFEELEVCQRNAFKHAFAWGKKEYPVDVLKGFTRNTEG